MSISRRNFLTASASVASGLLFGRFAPGQAATVASDITLKFAAPGESKIKYFGAFSELPAGAVQPLGWIKGWLNRQFDGLTGHPENLAWPFDTCMYTGKVPLAVPNIGQVWWAYEQSGYFVDGATRLSVLIDNPAAKKIPEANINYILSHTAQGKLGESTWGWPNTVVGRALMAEYGATGNTAIAQAMATSLIGNRLGGSRDGYVFEQALFLFGLTGDARLLDIAKTGYDRFFISDPKSFSHTTKIKANAPLREHGVTAAEQLKLLPLMYSYTGDKEALDLARTAYKKVVADSMMPDGGMVSSENLGTAAFASLHETCDIVDWSWSIGYMLLASGEGQWADIIERATFNALPGVVTKDFKQLQYFSSVDQVLCSSTACGRIAMTRMSYRAAHETPCCTGNVNRGMPNYVTRMWMRTEAGLAAALYGPSEVKTKIKGEDVTITQETDYPFRDTITFKVKLAQPLTFALSLRIPEWCESPAITVNGTQSPASPKAGTFAALNREFKDGDTITLKLPMTVALEDWFNGAAMTVKRGPLVYSLKITEKRVESTKEPTAIQRVLKQQNVQGFPAVEFFPESEWRFGIEAALKTALNKIEAKESPMPDNPFLSETVPVSLSLPLRPLTRWAANWKPVMDPPPADLKQSPQNPGNLPTAAELQSAGPVQTMTLIPYGSTHLRVTTLPVIHPA